MNAIIVLAVVATIAAGSPAWAAQGGEEQKQGQQQQQVQGPGKWTFGRLDVALDKGASSQVEYQPDTHRLVLKTLAGEARVIISARYLILVENVEGTVAIHLPVGRVLNVEPGRSEIVGRALVDDPGQLIIRIASTVAITVLEDLPAARLAGVQTPPGGEFHGDAPIRPFTPRPEGDSTLPVSPSLLRKFGRQF